MSRKLILIGGGGHCKSVLDTVLRLGLFDGIGIVDLPENVGKLVLGVPIIACDNQLPSLKDEGYTDAFITLGSIGNPDKRINAQRLLEKMGYAIPNIIDQTADVGEQVTLGQGIFIGKKAIVNAGSTIGDGAIINTATIVEHDCTIGAFVHVAPGSVLCGNVQIGEGTHIGAGSVVKQSVVIGDRTVIGLGSVVLQNIASQTTAFGNPWQGAAAMSVMIIAEAGVNHNGSIAIAKKMIDAAKAAGVDCIKFQTFIAAQIVSVYAQKADYQKKQTAAEDSQLDMLKKLELSFQDFSELKKYCENVGILFLSTPFDLESIAFLTGLDMAAWKIPSGEITNYPYLVKIALTHKPVILSTGMCELPEIEAAVCLLQEKGCGPISLLHCTTEYPAPYMEANLKAMATLRDKFQMPVGYSDHTQGIEISIAAAALGATIIEKHFTLDRNMAGPDHQASLEPDELKAMVSAIRHVEQAMGSGEKKPAASEIKNIAIARKSITASRPIKKGERFTEENLTTKRPGNGISPMKWHDVMDQVASRDFKKDELIE